jgi:hypothetical protein
MVGLNWVLIGKIKPNCPLPQTFPLIAFIYVCNGCKVLTIVALYVSLLPPMFELETISLHLSSWNLNSVVATCIKTTHAWKIVCRMNFEY